MKDWLIDKLGLEPGKPKWWGLQKFSWKGSLIQQLLLHPFFVFAVVWPLLFWGMTWYTFLWMGFALMVEHEWTQFSARPSGMRHLNLLERATDVLGGMFGSQVIYWIYYGILGSL